MCSRIKICLLSSIPLTLWSFYRSLPAKLKKEGFDVEICTSPGKELDFFAEQFEIVVHEINFYRKITPLQDLISILKLVKIFKENSYDIIHAHTPKAGFLSILAGSLAGIQCCIYTCHGLPMETEIGFKRKILFVTEKISCTLAHHVLAVSNSLASKLRDYHMCQEQKLSVLADGTACGIDLNRFTVTDMILEKSRDIRKRHQISDNDIVVGFVGRLVPDKGIHILVKSFVQLYDAYPNMRLVIVGGDDLLRGQLSEEITSILSSHPGIINVGFTNDIEPYYVAMDMLVLPTRREGFPYTVLEAAAMGIPVIATKVTGCVDAVIDGETGMLIPPDDVIALNNAIKRFIMSPQLCVQMGQQAREFVETKFSSQRLLDAHIQLYREILDS